MAVVGAGRRLQLGDSSGRGLERAWCRTVSVVELEAYPAGLRAVDAQDFSIVNGVDLLAHPFDQTRAVPTTDVETETCAQPTTTVTTLDPSRVVLHDGVSTLGGNWYVVFEVTP